MVLTWRIRPEVTRFMNTDLANDPEQQRRWYETSVRGNPNAHYWIIEYQARPIGVINLAKLDTKNKRTGWGIYIGELDAQYLGGLIPPYLFNFVFSKYDWAIGTITTEVMVENSNVAKTQLFHGFKLTALLKDHVFKYGKYHDVAVYELTRENWDALKKKFGHYVAEFDIS